MSELRSESEFRCYNLFYSVSYTCWTAAASKPSLQEKVKNNLYSVLYYASFTTLVFASTRSPPSFLQDPAEVKQGPTCDCGFPCTFMWRQTSSRTASPGSIPSCSPIQAVTRVSTQIRWAPPASLFPGSEAPRNAKDIPLTTESISMSSPCKLSWGSCS